LLQLKHPIAPDRFPEHILMSEVSEVIKYALKIDSVDAGFDEYIGIIARDINTGDDNHEGEDLLEDSINFISQLNPHIPLEDVAEIVEDICSTLY
jgi:hypothetical protein